MRKKFTIVLVISNTILAAVLIADLYLHWVSPGKIAYVHSAKLVSQYRGMAEARKAYEQKAVQWQANIDTLAMEWEKEMTAFRQEEGSMTRKERELTQELLEQKQQQLVDYQQAIQQQAEQEDLEMTRKVLGEINRYLTEYGKERGYRVILAATDMGNIAYATEAMDITAEVLEGLNETYMP